ncbi:cytochrome b/b6 domain-containing protein [Idiomarina loihiensis]|nr:MULTISPECIES: cytochrome b/b6 domain-containing protein [unclassified Idiomarina]
MHSYIAWGLLFLVAGHIGMAFIHQFIIKDGTLKRMM